MFVVTPYFNIGIYAAALTVLIDQGTKAWVLGLLSAQTPIIRMSEVLNLRLSWNKGVTFGLLADHGEWMPYLLIGVATIISALLLNWLRQSKTLYASLGIGLVLGGAIGNIIDRLHHGAVVDFLDFHLGEYHWYTFNMADSAICIGVGLLLLENMLETSQKKEIVERRGPDQ